MGKRLLTCAIVAASEFNAEHFEACRRDGVFDGIIALDGGYAHLEAVNAAPDLVVGDFDSLGYIPEGDNVVVHPVKKDKSDLELGLEEARARGFSRAFVYGALGGRLDHTIAAMQLCASYAEQGFDVMMIGSDTQVKILVGPATYEMPPLPSGTVSVFSAKDESVGVSERGMEYPLENAQLKNRTTLGLSNELLGKPASVTLDSGTLYIFHPVFPCYNDTGELAGTAG